jgi:ATP/maltotriose-dependent transcriptional regulator MalT
MGEIDRALLNGNEALQTAEEVGNHWFASYCHIELGNVHQAMDNLDEAERHFRSALHIKKAYKDPEGIAVTAKHLGNISLLHGDLDSAQDFFERSLSSYQNLNDLGGLSAAQHGLGKVALQKGSFRVAADRFRRSLEIASSINFLPLLLSLLLDIGIMFQESNHEQRGAELLHLIYSHPASNPQQKKIIRSRFEDFEAIHDSSLPDFYATVSSLPSELIDFEPIPRSVDESPLIDPLTKREKDVLSLVSQGLSNPAIAEELTISVGTVKAHTHRIYGKLGVSNRVEAVTKAQDLSLLS